MNKWIMGIVSSFACLLMLFAGMVAIISVIYAISYSSVHIWRLALALPLAAGGLWLLRWIDKKSDM